MLKKNRITLTFTLVMLASLVLAACAPAGPSEDEVAALEAQLANAEATASAAQTAAEEAAQAGASEEEIANLQAQLDAAQAAAEEAQAAADAAAAEAAAAAEEEAAPVEFNDPDPNTFVHVTFGDSDTLDPALAYDTASAHAIRQVYDTLVWFNREDATSFVPLLADSWEISADGLTYTFHIREGVTFHEGQTLEASDAAYSFQRGLLQSDPNGPQWLLTEPFLGAGTFDIAELVDPDASGDPEALAAADPDALLAACETVTSAITADDASGTLTFNLVQPWGPLMATLVGNWGSILDKDWAIENGAWDGDCANWVNWYAPGAEIANAEQIGAITNGTGPFKLESWTPNEEMVFVRNDDYWQTEPLYEGGHSGPAAFERYIIRIIPEFGTAYATLQAGDADYITVNTADWPQADTLVGEDCDYQTGSCEVVGDGVAQRWAGMPRPARTDIFMNFNVNNEGGNPYIGSGQLDGEGVNPEFFGDKEVRLAIATCFDYETYNRDALQGEGVRNNSSIITDMLGWNPDDPVIEQDLDACEQHFATAWDGVLPETGFRVQALYNIGNTTRQTAAQILAVNARSVNSAYEIQNLGVPWPTYLREFRAGRLPLAISGWLEDIHDPHNWVQPFTIGTYAGRQNMPDDMRAQFTEYVNAGVAASDPAERQQIYEELNAFDRENLPTIHLFQVPVRRYFARWVQGFYYNPAYFGPFFVYDLSTN